MLYEYDKKSIDSDWRPHYDTKNSGIYGNGKNGGYATFQQLNYLVDTSEWNTKTPDATIRRIVQNSNDFSKLSLVYGL